MQVKNDSLSCLFKYFQVYQNYLWFGLEWRDFDWMVAADGQGAIHLMVCVWHERTLLHWFKSCCCNHMFCQSSMQKMILKTFHFVKMSCPSDPARLIYFQSWTLFSRSHPDSNRVAFRSGWSSGVKGCWFKPCNECIQWVFFIHWSVLRFWALLLLFQTSGKKASEIHF